MCQKQGQNERRGMGVQEIQSWAELETTENALHPVDQSRLSLRVLDRHLLECLLEQEPHSFIRQPVPLLAAPLVKTPSLTEAFLLRNGLLVLALLRPNKLSPPSGGEAFKSREECERCFCSIEGTSYIWAMFCHPPLP